MKSLHLFTKALIALVLLFGMTTIARPSTRPTCSTPICPAVSPNILATLPVPSPRANVWAMRHFLRASDRNQAAMSILAAAVSAGLAFRSTTKASRHSPSAASNWSSRSTAIPLVRWTNSRPMAQVSFNEACRLGDCTPHKPIYT